MTLSTSHNFEAEQGILACCLAEEDGANVDLCLSLNLKTEDFYNGRHGDIYDVLLKLREANKSVHEINVIEELRKAKSEITHTEIFEIQARVEVASESHTKAFVRVVLDCSKIRKLQRLGREIVESCEESEDPEEISASIGNSLIEINQDAQEDSTIAGAAGEVWDDLQAMQNGTYESYGLPFNVNSFDQRLPQGMEPGTVTVLSAPTSCGKSQLAINIAMSHAIKNNIAAGYASFEMLSKQLAKRMLQVSSGVNLARVRDGVATVKEMETIKETKDKLAATTILTDHRHRHIDTLASLARQWKRKHNISLLVIDYLQLLSPPNNKCSSVEAVAYNSRKVKNLSLDLQIPIILLSQVNREAVKRLEFKPGKGLLIHDLIGGSAIEADADNVCIFWPKEGDAAASRTLDPSGRPFMQMVGQFAKEREGTRGERFEFKFIEQKGRFH